MQLQLQAELTRLTYVITIITRKFGISQTGLANSRYILSQCGCALKCILINRSQIPPFKIPIFKENSYLALIVVWFFKISFENRFSDT